MSSTITGKLEHCGSVKTHEPHIWIYRTRLSVLAAPVEYMCMGTSGKGLTIRILGARPYTDGSIECEYELVRDE